MHIWKEYFDDYGVYIRIQVVTGVDGNFNILVIKSLGRFLSFRGPLSQVYISLFISNKPDLIILISLLSMQRYQER